MRNEKSSLQVQIVPGIIACFFSSTVQLVRSILLIIRRSNVVPGTRSTPRCGVLLFSKSGLLIDVNTRGA